MSGYEPRFDQDYAFGRRGEERVGDMIEALKTGSVRVEVKTKRTIDGWVYVELEQDPGGTGQRWKPSGLNVTESELWVYNINETGFLVGIPTDLLRWAVDTGSGRKSACPDGDNPTRGRLLLIPYLVQEGMRGWLMDRDKAA